MSLFNSKTISLKALAFLWILTAAAGNTSFSKESKVVDADSQAAADPISANLYLSHSKIAPGETFQFALQVNMEEGWHINSSNPGQFNIKTEVGFLDPKDITNKRSKEQFQGDLLNPPKSSFSVRPATLIKSVGPLSLQSITYPPGKMIDFMGEPLSAYESGTWIFGKVLVDEKALLQKTSFAFGLTFQACKEQCLAPETIQLKAGVDIVEIKDQVGGRHSSIFQKSSGKKPEATGSGGKKNGKSFSKTTNEENTTSEPLTLGLAILLGFFGGLILNIMPCVLPVISLKIFSLVQQGKENPGVVLRHGLAYVAGVMLSFWIFAGIVISIKSSGGTVGWGFQLQSPLFVTLLAAFVFAFGLSMMGVFEIPMLGIASIEKAASKPTAAGSFVNGLFATILATPCIAPLLAPALGFALSQPATTIFAVFTAVGFGLAWPFLLLAIWPGWAQMMPKPGNWMVIFKEVMGFLLIGTVIWLLWVLIELCDPWSFIESLIFLGLTAMFCWALGRWGKPVSSKPAKRITLAMGVLVLSVAGITMLDFKEAKGGVEWIDFSEAKIQEITESNRPVFVDATATWCFTCKVNEAGVIHTKEIESLLAELNYVTMKADFTKQDPVIAEWLQKHKSAGVPLYVIYPAKKYDSPVVLPTVLTRELLSKALKGEAVDQGLNWTLVYIVSGVLVGFILLLLVLQTKAKRTPQTQ